MNLEKKIKMALAYGEASQAELARRLGTTPANFNHRLKGGTFKVDELEKIAEIIGETAILVDVLPLPFIRQRIGPVVINPPCKEIEDLIRPLGDLIALEDKTEMAAMRTITALMSPFYELCYAVTEWGMDNSLS